MRRLLALIALCSVSLVVVGCMELEDSSVTEESERFSVAEQEANVCPGNSCSCDMPAGGYYVGDPEMCTRINFFCEEGFEYYSDSCGCGCAPIEPVNPCMIAGCSGQYCIGATDDPISSTCEYRADYACYQTATCETQNNGQCGWTQTRELRHCIRDARHNGPRTTTLQ